MKPELRKQDLLHPELSFEIVGVLFDVENRLGPGHKEKNTTLNKCSRISKLTTSNLELSRNLLRKALSAEESLISSNVYRTYAFDPISLYVQSVIPAEAGIQGLMPYSGFQFSLE